MRERPDAPLGTLIFRAGLLPAETIENALEEGVRTGRRLGEILIERGLLREDDLAPLLAGQRGIPFVRLGERAVDPTAARLLDEDHARLLNALPIDFEDGVPVVAVTDPTNDVVMRNVREAMDQEVRLVVAARGELVAAIERVYHPQVLTDEPLEAPIPTEAEPPLEAPRLLVADEPPAPEGAAAPPAPNSVAEPAPEAEPEPEAEAAPQLEAEPEAAPEAQPEAEGEPAEPLDDHDPEPEQERDGDAEPELEPATSAPAPPAGTSENGSRPGARVSIRLTTGERVVVSESEEAAEAKGYARALMKQLAEAEAGEWPFVNGRFLKPDTIVSVDVEEL